MAPAQSRWFSSCLIAATILQGFLSMGFQLVASRLLAPVFGTTLLVWTGIISIFLAAFSLGALAGGFVSRLNAELIRAVFPGLAILGVGGFAITALFGHALIVRLDGLTDNLALSLGIACLALFLVPTAAVSCILPILTEALITRGSRGGMSTGVVYATSTLGNIVGVLTTALVLIPNYPTSTILFFWVIAAVICFSTFYFILLIVPFKRTG